ncbi:hypothetical protein PMAYCL1PPCAC_25783, partial [Pristionchus mayeri]
LQKVHKDPAHARSLHNWILYYKRRWLRLAPTYLLFIGFYVAWIPRMHGAYASANPEVMYQAVKNCEENWWMNILFINNFISMNDMCYGITWYLSVDMQFYWIAPLFLIALHYSWKSGVASAVFGIILSASSIIFLIVHFDLPAMGFNTFMAPGDMAELRLNFLNYVYVKPWTRCIPYLVGILSGYLIVQVEKKNISIRRPKTKYLLVCWMLATAAALVHVFGVYNYIRDTSTWGVALRSIYAAYSRIGSTAAVAWVVIACSFDWAGPVKAILEHPLWRPLGRLSFCTYLVHYFVLLV